MDALRIGRRIGAGFLILVALAQPAAGALTRVGGSQILNNTITAADLGVGPQPPHRRR